jgi:hypothetical protein
MISCSIACFLRFVSGTSLEIVDIFLIDSVEYFQLTNPVLVFVQSNLYYSKVETGPQKLLRIFDFLK